MRRPACCQTNFQVCERWLAQFAVFQNPGRSADIPFVVQIQSSRLNAATDRVVMALVRRVSGSPPDHPLTPHLTVAGQAVYADPLNLATIRASALKFSVGVLAEHDQDRIIQAIDEMISRA